MRSGKREPHHGRMRCPNCKEAELVEKPGQLDQCGETYLPATEHSCEYCGWLEMKPTGEPSRSRWAPLKKAA